MAIAEIDPVNGVHMLDNLSQSVDLGKDTFTRGSLRKETIEECVRVLRSYRQVLDEYDITRDEQIRVVATSAVREAENSLAFVDRVFIATGFHVEPIDEAEVNRVTYLGVLPLLESDAELLAGRNMILEVGGGSSEVLIVENRDVLFSRTYRLGSMRLRETLDAFHAPATKVRHLMESQIRLTVDDIADQVPREPGMQIIALGGDLRFAAAELLPTWNMTGLARLPTSELEAFANKVFGMSSAKLIQRYHLTPSDAETLGPALLAYVELAKAFELQQIVVANITLRDGLLKQMLARGKGIDHFDRQIIRSATDLAAKYQCDLAHCGHVAELARSLFRALQAEHQLEPHYELLIYLAALLHETGLFIGTASHHKHSLYIITNSDLFGLSKDDTLLVGLVARYYRRASPKPAHPGYASLDRKRRVAVAKLASLLRIADALDCSRSQRIAELHCVREHGKLVIYVPTVDDLSLEQIAVDQKGLFFEETFGMEVLLRSEAH